MASLHAILDDAARRGADTVELESGQPALVSGASGGMPVGEALSDAALHDALAAVLTDEQQVELAVGNLVEFELATGDRAWTLIVEPGLDGIRVRGLRRASVDEVDLDVDLDGSESRGARAVELPAIGIGADARLQAPTFSGDEVGVELPSFDIDDAAEPPAPAIPDQLEVPERPTRREPLDVGGPADVEMPRLADEAPTHRNLPAVGSDAPSRAPLAGPPPTLEDDVDFAFSPAVPEPPPAPAEDPFFAARLGGPDPATLPFEGDDDRFAAPLDGPGGSGSGPLFPPPSAPAAPTAFSPAPPPAVAPAPAQPPSLPSQASRASGIAPPPPVSPGVAAARFTPPVPLGGAASLPDLPESPASAAGAPRTLQMPKVPDDGAASAPAAAASAGPTGGLGGLLPPQVPRPSAPSGASGPTSASAPAPVSDGAAPGPAGWLEAVPLGAVVAVRAGDAVARAAESLARRTGGAVVRVTAAEPEGGPFGLGTVIVVEREDPAPALPWLLRRLEEGAIVVLASGARTPEGARRTLLGVHASARAEAWLAAFPWISAADA